MREVVHRLITRWTPGVFCLLTALIFGTGCRSAADSGDEPPPWDVARAEVIRWQSDDPSFGQDFALEASGLAASEHGLYVPSEKYARLLLIDPEAEPRARILRLEVPGRSELEGIAVVDGGVLLCDEAHAAVYEVTIGDDDREAADVEGEPLVARELPLDGVDVEGDKIGFEGIEVDRNSNWVYLLLERTETDNGGCVSRIYRLRRQRERLTADRDPLDIELPDCTWRLTGLAWWGERMIALRTQYPGERYEVVAVDLATGAARVMLDLTVLLRALEKEGWSNNVEGIAVTRDGALWLVSDNAVTGIVDDPLPPSSGSRTLLLRIPPSTAPSE
jgi:hypothetical protein